MKITKLIQAKRIILERAQIKLSPKLSYKLLKFCKTIEDEESFYCSKQKELFELFCRKKEDGSFDTTDGAINIIEGKEEEFKKEFNELQNVEAENFQFFFSLEELSEIKLSVAEMVILEDLIKEE